MAFQSGCTGSQLEGKRKHESKKDSCYKNDSLVYLNYIDVRDKIWGVKMILKVFSNLRILTFCEYTLMAQ